MADLFKRVAFLDFPIVNLVFSNRHEQICEWMQFNHKRKSFALADVENLDNLGKKIMFLLNF